MAKLRGVGFCAGLAGQRRQVGQAAAGRGHAAPLVRMRSTCRRATSAGDVSGPTGLPDMYSTMPTVKVEDKSYARVSRIVVAVIRRKEPLQRDPPGGHRGLAGQP